MTGIKFHHQIDIHLNLKTGPMVQIGDLPCACMQLRVHARLCHQAPLRHQVCDNHIDIQMSRDKHHLSLNAESMNIVSHNLPFMHLYVRLPATQWPP